MPSSLIDEYLAAIDVTAISIVRTPGGHGYRVGRETPSIEGVVNTHWLTRSYAARVAREARASLGQYADKMAAERALQKAAHQHKQVLTPHQVVISRATVNAKKLNVMLKEMTKSGQLEAFHKDYKRRRQTAKKEGKGFISYRQATNRLRRALIRRLVERVPVNQPGLFAEVFRQQNLRNPLDTSGDSRKESAITLGESA